MKLKYIIIIIILIISFTILFVHSRMEVEQKPFLNESSDSILNQKALKIYNIFVDCEDILESYENMSKTLIDYAGITVFAVSYCYDFKYGNLNLTYEDLKWKKLNSCWLSEDFEIGNCNDWQKTT